MDITNIKTFFFSPTGTSKKIVQAIAEGKQTSQTISHIDLTYPNHPTDISVGGNELAIIAVPVYAGRIAPLAKKRLQNISGNNSPTILVVLYGNREFEDALIELKDLVTAQAFNVVAACAFIGEHSFSSADMPISPGRPDTNDLKIATEFGAKVMQQLATTQVSQPIDVPGDTPYRDGMKNLPFTPKIDSGLCTQCGECIAACPAGAISLNVEIQILTDSCTFCCACIKACPEECISLTSTPMQEKAVWLNTNCKDQKKPQLFL
ncbi:MAG: hypothetical protein COA36_15605 [Desulfotalea sp.]|nr:MAG: hypothetical protein COA36_15605 [Desulfotalea sp.]